MQRKCISIDNAVFSYISHILIWKLYSKFVYKIYRCNGTALFRLIFKFTNYIDAGMTVIRL